MAEEQHIIVLSRSNHHQGYKVTETLRFQRHKHLVNTEHDKCSNLKSDSERNLWDHANIMSLCLRGPRDYVIGE